MAIATLTGALAALGLTLLDFSGARRAASLTRRLAVLCYGLHGILMLVFLIEKSSSCGTLALAAKLASFMMGRISLALHLGHLIRGPLLAQVLPQALLMVIAFLSFGMQTAAAARLADSSGHLISAAFILDLLFLGGYGAWLLFCICRDIIVAPAPSLSATERQLLPNRPDLMSKLPRDFEQKCCLLATAFCWLGTSLLDLLQAITLRDYSELIVVPDHQALWLATTFTTLFGFLSLTLTDSGLLARSLFGAPAYTQTARKSSKAAKRKTWRKSRSPVWPSESVMRPVKLDIEPFENHPYASSVGSAMSSPTVSEQLLKSIEDDFGSIPSPTILVYSPEEVENHLIELNSPPSPDHLSPTFSSTASAGHRVAARSPSPDTFPVTPSLDLEREEDELAIFAPALPPAYRSPPLSSPPLSPLPSIPEEENDDVPLSRFISVPARPEPAETKRMSAIYHRPTMSVSAEGIAALGILVG